LTGQALLWTGRALLAPTPQNLPGKAPSHGAPRIPRNPSRQKTTIHRRLKSYLTTLFFFLHPIGRRGGLFDGILASLDLLSDLLESILLRDDNGFSKVSTRCGFNPQLKWL
jgi:hypothetical protein